MTRLNYGHVVAIGNLTDCLPIVRRDALPQGKRCVSLDEDGLVRLWEPQYVEKRTVGGLVVTDLYGHCSDITSESEADFGDYTPGRVAWEFADLKPLCEPVAIVGRQGLFWVDLPLEVAS
jgi:hypothetical protein